MTSSSANKCDVLCNYPNDDENIDVANEIDVSRYSSWSKLINVTANLLSFKYKCLKRPLTQVEAQSKAEILWYKSLMSETKKMMTKTKLPGFIVVEMNGIVYATTRQLNENYNPDRLIILSPRHPVTKLILRGIHEEDHRGVQHTVARSRLKFWIPQCSKVVRRIKDSCFKCKLKDAVAIRQLMSPMPNFRMKSAPVWNHSMIDLFGPIQIKDPVNSRTTKKTWAVLITCLHTRAVQCYLAQSYSTDDLLLVLTKHESRNGSPSHYYADLGTQLVGADRAMSEALNKLEIKKFEAFAKNNKTSFHFGSPHHPQGQGAVERLVQEMKKSLKVLTNNYVVSFNEMDAALAEASYLVNCRPLQISPKLGDDGFICPNDIIMGRSDKAPVIDNAFDTNLTKRVAHMRKMVLEFWAKWSFAYYHTLVKYNRWRLKYRNCEPGDVVLILDKESPKGKFVLGLIDTVKIDSDQVVRKVTVKYKLPQSGDDLELKHLKYKYGERNVRGLALLVTAQERKIIEVNGNIDIDQVRFQDISEDDDSQDDEKPSDDEINPSNEENDVSEDAIQNVDANPVNFDQSRLLKPSSSGRIRLKPKKLDL